MTLRPALAGLLLLGATPSLAAGRVPYGGELRVAHPGPAEPGEPALADSPLEATLLGLLSRPACHLGPDGSPSPALARELSRPAETGGTLSTWNGCAAPGTALAYWRQDGAFAVSAAWLDRVLGEQIAVAAEGEAPAAPHFLKPRPPTRAVPDQKPPSGPKFVRPKSILP